MNYLVVIPARGGSKGIRGKNIKLINGKPLIGSNALAGNLLEFNRVGIKAITSLFFIMNSAIRRQY